MTAVLLKKDKPSEKRLKECGMIGDMDMSRAPSLSGMVEVKAWLRLVRASQLRLCLTRHQLHHLGTLLSCSAIHMPLDQGPGSRA